MNDHAEADGDILTFDIPDEALERAARTEPISGEACSRAMRRDLVLLGTGARSARLAPGGRG
jgi:hypothetical protein